MKFDEENMAFTDLTNFMFGTGRDITVNLDDDLVPVSVEYYVQEPRRGAAVTIKTAANGYIITNDLGEVHVVAHQSPVYLTEALAEFLVDEVKKVTPFNQDDWSVNFTEAALEEINND